VWDEGASCIILMYQCLERCKGDLMQTREDHWKIMEMGEKKLQVEFSVVLLMGVSYYVEA
jgi:hypothetical protein